MRPPPTHLPVCVCTGVCLWSPLGSPPHRALTWVPVCCEGHLVTPLLGSCNPGPSVSAASVAFPRKGGWAEAMSSASLSSQVARSGGWSSGAALLAGAHPAQLSLAIRSVLSMLKAL